MKYTVLSAALLSSGSLVSAASAADLPLPVAASVPLNSPADFYKFYIHLGPAAIVPDASAKVYTPFGRIPGATIKIPAQVTPSAEVGYRFTPNWAVSVVAGIPPTSTIHGAGTSTALGKLGSNVYGPVSVTGHYHFTNFGAFQPYIGGGLVYNMIFNTRDGALTDLKVKSSFGALVQVGADYMLTNRLGVFVDFKKAYLRTTAHGRLGAIPIHSDITLDPYVFSGGVTYRF